MKPYVALALVVALSILLGLFIYFNPLSSRPPVYQQPEQPTTAVQNFDDLVGTLNVKVSRTGSGPYTYSGVIAVPTSCEFGAGATVFGDTETKVIIALTMVQKGDKTKPCTAAAPTTIMPFSVQANTTKLVAVTVNGRTIKSSQ